jgi:hypothetical protein
MKELVKPEGVSLYNPSYAHLLLNTEPFPDAEYAELVAYFLANSPVYSVKESETRQGTVRRSILRYIPRLLEQSNGGKALYDRVIELRRCDRHLAALINLRLAKEYMIRLGTDQHGAPWLAPALADRDFTNTGADTHTLIHA